jgi:hypothetical protein
VRALILMPMVLAIGGCGDLFEIVFPPSDGKIARRCGVTEAEFKQAKAAVGKLQPYAQQELGSCRIFKNEGRGVSILTIEEPTVVAN